MALARDSGLRWRDQNRGRCRRPLARAEIAVSGYFSATDQNGAVNVSIRRVRAGIAVDADFSIVTAGFGFVTADDPRCAFHGRADDCGGVQRAA